MLVTSAVLALDFLLGKKSVLLFVLIASMLKETDTKRTTNQGLELTHEREGPKNVSEALD
jgi:hypothetical protein